jgi:hypothetical protein
VTSDGLDRLWLGIEASPLPAQLGWVRRTANPGAAVPVSAAVACRGGARCLLIDIPVALLARLQDLPSTGGLAVELVPALQGVPESHRTLAVTLDDRQYWDLFSVFCADVVDGISRCGRVQDAIVLLLQRLGRWQQFLSAATEGLTRQGVVGLFGELWVLRDILIPLAGISMLESWCGADRKPQDFIVPGLCALEVKTTAGQVLSSVRIHGQQQLDDSGLACLYLVCLRLQHDDGVGESLNQLVDDLRAQAATLPEFAALLEGRLSAAGWLERHRQRYDGQRHLVAQRRFFRVNERFPRLVSASLPVGIDGVEYQLDLRACEDHECGQAELADTLRGLPLAREMQR